MGKSTIDWNKTYKQTISKTAIDLDTIDMLFSKGADPRLQNQNGYTLLQIASMRDWSEAGSLRVIAACVKTNKLSNKDISSAYSQFLSNATKCYYFSVIQAFIDAGANPLAKNANNKTIFEIGATASWTKEQLLKIIEISESSKKLTPKDYEQS